MVAGDGVLALSAAVVAASEDGETGAEQATEEAATIATTGKNRRYVTAIPR
jgi:hypothetical protein